MIKIPDDLTLSQQLELALVEETWARLHHDGYVAGMWLYCVQRMTEGLKGDAPIRKALQPYAEAVQRQSYKALIRTSAKVEALRSAITATRTENP